MAIPNSFIEELKSKNDIVEVVGKYVNLTKKGDRNLFGLCPFHSEKTASFSVSPEKQSFHCFGCGKGGDVIRFIMEIEKLPYIDAVKYLANQANMRLPNNRVNERTENEREIMLRLNLDATQYFCDCLHSPLAKEANEYLNQRGLSQELITKFRIGFAPESWTDFTSKMRQKGYKDQQLIDAFLAFRTSKAKQSVYPAFRNRIIFPIMDIQGNVVGFSGRSVGNNGPKYLNSANTVLFNKSRNLFALNIARKSNKDRIILVEGVMDAVALNQFGFEEAVASLGTSLTNEQAKLLSHYTKEVVVAYDSDNAGLRATDRAVSILKKAGLKVRVLPPMDKKDPDEYIRTKGSEAFSRLIEKSLPYAEYKINSIRDHYNFETIEGRLAFFEEVAEFICTMDSAVERETFATYVAEAIGVSSEAAIDDISKRREGLR